MRQIASRKSVILITCLMLNTILLPLQVAGQSGGFVVTPLVKRGDPVSDGGRFFDCNGCEGRVIGLHAFNNQGDVAIGADVGDGSCSTGRFIISSGGSIRLVDFCQMTPFGQFNLLGPVNINDQREAAINTGVIVNNIFIDMLLHYSEGELTQIVKEGDMTPAGTVFTGCGFGQPAINNRGEVAFHACAEAGPGAVNDGIFLYSNGSMRQIVANGDPSPFGGRFIIAFFPAQAVQINDNGDVLFRADVNFDVMTQNTGLFLAKQDGIEKILFDRDPLPTGGIVTPRTPAIGDLNNKGEVAFAVGLTGGSTDSAIFFYSNKQFTKVMAAGDPTPIAGRFATLVGDASVLPRINENGAVAFRASVTEGRSKAAIFLASPRAIVKVAALGDNLPTGGKITEIRSFALNDFGQVAFFAEVKNGPKGVFLATPLPPTINKIKLKQKSGNLELRVNGTGMITNDTVIEINGLSIGNLSYPESFRQNGGTTRQTVSKDTRLEELLPAGQAVQVTLFNPLTNLRSAPVMFTRQ